MLFNLDRRFVIFNDSCGLLERLYNRTEFNMYTLIDLSPGESGVIAEVNATGELRRRLMDMGIITGAMVKMVKTAPLGDPLQIRVHNTLIALRKTEAETIVIEEQGDGGHERHHHRHRARG
jgi:Fe2+ transport system protein FeoA